MKTIGFVTCGHAEYDDSLHKLLGQYDDYLAYSSTFEAYAYMDFMPYLIMAGAQVSSELVGEALSYKITINEADYEGFMQRIEAVLKGLFDMEYKTKSGKLIEIPNDRPSKKQVNYLKGLYKEIYNEKFTYNNQDKKEISAIINKLLLIKEKKSVAEAMNDTEFSEHIKKMPYLKKVSTSTAEWIIKILKEEKFNVYLSIYNAISSRSGYTYEDNLSFYLNKHVSTRPYLHNCGAQMIEIFNAVYKKKASA